MRLADARFAASIMISSSIRYSLGFTETDCTMNRSWPRTLSCSLTNISPSGKRVISTWHSSTPADAAIRSAKARCPVPEIIFISLPFKWLPDQGSNLDPMSQSHMCFHYTIGQAKPITRAFP